MAAKHKRVMKTPLSQELRAAGRARLGELKATHITSLTGFAERRLASMGLPLSAGEDVTQRALLAVLKGLETDQGSRRPHLEDLQDIDTFQNFLRSVISSLIEGMSRQTEFRKKETWDENTAAAHVGSTGSSWAPAELNDFQRELFARLRARAPQRLQPTIDLWQKAAFDADRVPALTNQKYAHEVRLLARKILAELELP
jgi:hypothetical protein